MQSLHDMQSGKAVVAAAVTTAYMHMMRVSLSCATYLMLTSLRKQKNMPTHPCIKQCIKVNGADQPHTETGKLQNSNRGVAKSVRFRNERTLLPAKCVIY